MAKKQCNICGADLGLLAYKIEFTDGKAVCKNCTSKAGIKTSDISGISFDMIKEWVEDPTKSASFFQEREEARLEAERIEKERKEEQARIERERREEERRRQEEQRRMAEEERKEAERQAEEERRRIERERFPEGRVRVTIEQVSFTQLGAVFGSGNALDATVQNLQDRGCQIMNVTCFASGDNSAYVQAVIVYREPPV